MENDRNAGASLRLDFEVVSEKKLFDAKIFTLEEALCRSPQGLESGFYRLRTPDWANILAETRDDQGRKCFVMVRQYRHGSRTLVWEFPGGLVDPGEDPRTAALRELEEETGYRADTAELLGSCNPNPAFMTNQAYTFFTDQMKGGFAQEWDEHEFLEVGLIPVEEVLAGLGRPPFDHGVMMMAAFWYVNSRRKGQ